MLPAGVQLPDRVTNVRSVRVRHHLTTPIRFGNWVMTHRDFVLVRVDVAGAPSGFAYGLTRDGPVSEIVRATVGPAYLRQAALDPGTLFEQALWTNHAVHAAGIGMRALSLVDLATWDALARCKAVSLTRLLGGQPTSMPVTAIVGYPPDTSPSEVRDQVSDLLARGWRRFKLPIAPDLDATEARLRAARSAAPDSWIGLDINMALHTVSSVCGLEERVRDLQLGWLEDVVPPGSVDMVRRIRAASVTPIAMGDEQGGSYHPEALLAGAAIDVLRVDATTNGGVSRMPSIVEQARRAGVAISPHMFPHVHSRLLPGIGATEVPIEWGLPATGVHPWDDSLEQPQVADGMMLPLDDAPGLGRLINLVWLGNQEVHDPDGVLTDLPPDVLVAS